jgi:hypothetical protein
LRVLAKNNFLRKLSKISKSLDNLFFSDVFLEYLIYFLFAEINSEYSVKSAQVLFAFINCTYVLFISNIGLKYRIQKYKYISFDILNFQKLSASVVEKKLRQNLPA